MSAGEDHQGSGDPNAGWYPDPHVPGTLRYWDGTVWTDHTHRDDGRLPDLGKWLSNTFAAIGAYGFPAAILSFGLAALANIVTAGGLWWATGGLAVIDETLIGADSPALLRFAIVVIALLLVQCVTLLALARFAHRAHQQADPNVADSLVTALARLPRMIAVFLPIAIATALAMLILGLVAAPLGEGGFVLMLLVMLVAGVWVFVKLSFLTNAIVATPRGTSAIRASAGVSSGRFWPVFGRIALLLIMVIIFSSMASAVFGPYGSPVDQQALTDVFVAQSDGSVVVRDFAFRDMLPSGAQTIGYVVVSSIINGLAGLVMASAMMRLYLDSGAPAELA